ncbi:hypothetical protein T439DRAFT_322390 [Meredithblackwellia eburnea MCA 4105]
MVSRERLNRRQLNAYYPSRPRQIRRPFVPTPLKSAAAPLPLRPTNSASYLNNDQPPPQISYSSPESCQSFPHTARPIRPNINVSTSLIRHASLLTFL